MASPATLKDYIDQNKQNGISLAFLLAGSSPISGQVVGVGNDYVVVMQGATPRAVPFSAIAWVTPN